jgi:hypothetical protein
MRSEVKKLGAKSVRLMRSEVKKLEAKSVRLMRSEVKKLGAKSVRLMRSEVKKLGAKSVRLMRSVKEISESDRGSISPLIAMYFTIAMLGTFLISNITATYVDRRELINLTESALARATQELDEFRYYYRIPIPGVTEMEILPINCSDAGAVFSRDLELLGESNNPIRIINFECDGETLRSTVSRKSDLPFAVNIFGMETFLNKVQISAQARFK